MNEAKAFEKRRKELEGQGYDIALICSNGHVINTFVKQMPSRKQEYCEECGAVGVFYCSQCKLPIKGGYILSLQFPTVEEKFSFPKFCTSCGAPFPWTETQLAKAKSLVEEISTLNQSEKDLLKQSIDDLVRDTPKTQVAASRFKEFTSRAGKGIAGAFKDILIDVVSEAAKKIIWPSS